MINYSKHLLLASFFVSIFTFAQSGPGGVGNATTNGLWLKSDDFSLADNGEGISNWQDTSGNGNDANQPTLNESPSIIGASSFNNYPSLNFDGVNDWMKINDADILDGTTSINFFSVYKPKGLGASNTVQTILSKRNGYQGANLNYAYTFFFYNDKLTNDIVTANDRYDTSNTVFNNDENYILSFDFDGNLTNSNRSAVSRNGLSFNRRFEASVSIMNSNAPITLGRLNIGDLRFSKSEMAEVIHYNYKLNPAETIIVNNYLSAKYNIPLGLESNNLYTQDALTNGNYDHHVAGIARISNTTHLDSQGSGIVRINGPSDLNNTNDKYLFWGQNKMGSDYNFNTAIIAEDDSGVLHNYKHLNTIWRVSKSEDVQDLGRVDISFDISNIPRLSKCYPLELVIGSDHYNYSGTSENEYNSIFSSPQEIYPLTVVGDIASVNDVTIGDKRHFTLRYREELIVWDGTSFTGGSGGAGEPTNADSDKKLLILSGTTATLTQNAHVCEVELAIGAELIVNNNRLLDVVNNIHNDGKILINGESQLIQHTIGGDKNTGAGELIIRQQGSSNLFNYNYWSAPVNRMGGWQISYLEDNNGVLNWAFQNDADPSTVPITLSSKWLYAFNGVSENYYDWLHIGENTDVSPGIGYTMKGSGAGFPSPIPITGQEYVFRGTPNNGRYIHPLSTGNEILVGNPYPSALDADKFISDNASSITGALYFYEQFPANNTHVTVNYQGGYATYNLMMGAAAAALPANGGNSSKGAPTKNIAVGQGFFVKADSNGGDVVFKNTQRVFAKESVLDESTFFKTNGASQNTVSTDLRTKLWLTFTDPSQRVREIGLGYDDNATTNYDKGYDALDYDVFPDHMLWDIQGVKYVIQGRNNFAVANEMPLAIKTTTAGDYSIGLKETLNFPEATPIYLKDNVSGLYYNLKTEDASLFFEAGEYSNRYSIVYHEDDTLSADAIAVSDGISLIYDTTNQQLEIRGYDTIQNIKSLTVYSVLGQEIMTLDAVESYVIQLPKVSNGVYILEIVDVNNGKIAKKFVKQ
ncbi:T9SS type A sorting domain-containing protein [Bizionia gelidisalsuginis]|uniref:T9SS type A sorting domain-containing protein n=1 Tax=Bizionia gelidisalsuginis TaxID=291188 RepID=A0ABY3MAU7_9FLAO|nr:T9SS type A sorting domain-containing protein [Bizionia gelidisalsuginis]TYC12873.1 T9SS type A sorting domain-containing protein [Bizionia gelidisalsuginis]